MKKILKSINVLESLFKQVNMTLKNIGSSIEDKPRTSDTESDEPVKPTTQVAKEAQWEQEATKEAQSIQDEKAKQLPSKPPSAIEAKQQVLASDMPSTDQELIELPETQPELGDPMQGGLIALTPVSNPMQEGLPLTSSSQQTELQAASTPTEVDTAKSEEKPQGFFAAFSGRQLTSDKELDSSEGLFTPTPVKPTKPPPPPKPIPKVTATDAVGAVVSKLDDAGRSALGSTLDKEITSIFTQVAARSGRQVPTSSSGTAVSSLFYSLRGRVNEIPARRMTFEAIVDTLEQGIADPKQREAYLRSRMGKIVEDIQKAGGSITDPVTGRLVKAEDFMSPEEALAYIDAYDTRQLLSPSVRKAFPGAEPDPKTGSWDLHRAAGAEFKDVKQLVDLWFKDEPELVAPLIRSISSWTTLPVTNPNDPRTLESPTILRYLTDSESFSIAYRATVPDSKVLFDYIHSGSYGLDSDSGFQYPAAGGGYKPDLCEFVVMSSENSPILVDPRDATISAFGRYYTIRDRDQLLADVTNFGRLVQAKEELEEEYGLYGDGIPGKGKIDIERFPTYIRAMAQRKFVLDAVKPKADRISKEVGVDVLKLFGTKVASVNPQNYSLSSVQLVTPVLTGTKENHQARWLDALTPEDLEYLKSEANITRTLFTDLVAEAKSQIGEDAPQEELVATVVQLSQQKIAAEREKKLSDRDRSARHLKLTPAQTRRYLKLFYGQPETATVAPQSESSVQSSGAKRQLTEKQKQAWKRKKMAEEEERRKIEEERRRAEEASNPRDVSDDAVKRLLGL